MKLPKLNGIILAIVVAAAAGGGYYVWQSIASSELPAGIASGNGRIEAVEVDVAAKFAGRISEIFVDEGDFVKAGDKIAQIDTRELDTQLKQAEAQSRRADIGIETANAQVVQRNAEKRAAEAAIAQRKVQLESAMNQQARAEQLAKSSTISTQQLEDARFAVEGARAAVAAAEAESAAADAGISSANAQVVDAKAAADAAKAAIDTIQTQIEDSLLTAPRDGRVQFRVAQPGEIVAGGGRVVNLVDLGDVYMSFFLPTDSAGRLAIGSEARLKLDALPDALIPATVSYVASVAQFTPKSVETAVEREKLMFRVKAKIKPELLQKYIQLVKTGVPGVAYVRVDANTPWPADLEGKLVQ